MTLWTISCLGTIGCCGESRLLRGISSFSSALSQCQQTSHKTAYSLPVGRYEAAVHVKLPATAQASYLICTHSRWRGICTVISIDETGDPAERSMFASDCGRSTPGTLTLLQSWLCLMVDLQKADSSTRSTFGTTMSWTLLSGLGLEVGLGLALLLWVGQMCRNIDYVDLPTDSTIPPLTCQQSWPFVGAVVLTRFNLPSYTRRHMYISMWPDFVLKVNVT